MACERPVIFRYLEMHIKDYMHHMDHQEHLYWRKLIKKENPNRVFLSEYDYWNSVVNLLRVGKRYPKRKNVKLDFSPLP